MHFAAGCHSAFELQSEQVIIQGISSIFVDKGHLTNATITIAQIKIKPISASETDAAESKGNHCRRSRRRGKGEMGPSYAKVVDAALSEPGTNEISLRKEGERKGLPS